MDRWNNSWNLYATLTPPDPLMVGRVVSDDGQFSIVEVPPVDGASRLRVKDGPTAVPAGHLAFIQGGVIQGEAPSLTLITRTI